MNNGIEDDYILHGLHLQSYDDRFKLNSPFPNKEDCVYTPCYCEENIYKLCERLQDISSSILENCHVVFVSNESRKVPLWHQRAGHNSVGLVVWDYHVFLVYEQPNECLVYDFDTLLPYPTTFSHYAFMTFRSDRDLNPDYYRKFRVINGPTYLQKFSSDRRHMFKDGTWLKDPPTYKPISTPDCEHNLDSFISMNPDEGFGEVLILKQFFQRFAKSSGAVNMDALQLMI